MFKSLLAASAALLCSAPAFADPGAVFDNSARTSNNNGGCYQTTGGHHVCWQTALGRYFTVSLIEKQQPTYASTLFFECGGRWEGFGPASRGSMQSLVDAFCQEQR